MYFHFIVLYYSGSAVAYSPLLLTPILSAFKYCTVRPRKFYCQLSFAVLCYCLLLLVLLTPFSTVLPTPFSAGTALLYCLITASEYFLLLLYFPHGRTFYKMDTDIINLPLSTQRHRPYFDLCNQYSHTVLCHTLAS